MQHKNIVCAFQFWTLYKEIIYCFVAIWTSNVDHSWSRINECWMLKRCLKSWMKINSAYLILF